MTKPSVEVVRDVAVSVDAALESVVDFPEIQPDGAGGVLKLPELFGATAFAL